MAQLEFDLTSVVKLIVLAILTLTYFAISNIRQLARIPGPKSYASTKWRLAYEDFRARRTRAIHNLHLKYGPVVRIGPNELSFNSLTALRTIYGAGSGFERTSFYRMFDVYGEPNLFTFASSKEHGERKKLLSHAYSNSSILKSGAAAEEKAQEFMKMLDREPENASEIFSSLHYYSLDNITHFLYGEAFGATSAMNGSIDDRRLLDDVLDPSRRKLAWFAVHLPRYTKWLMSRTGSMERFVSSLGLFPQKKPTVYTGIRRHALNSWYKYLAASPELKKASKSKTIIGKLWDSHYSEKEGGLTDMQIASEVADHLLAGVDTTADTLMFLIWALSREINQKYQQKLVEEVRAISTSMLNEYGIPTVAATSNLPYLNAVIMETLRLYAPLPAAEPRSLPIDTIIDGHKIPANTIVNMSPYSLHRNEDVFTDSHIFIPERWLGDSKEVVDRKKWFWAFSSGGRMCIGMHLAMAEMTTLTATIYRKYRTKIPNGHLDMSPVISSRFETFFDEAVGMGKEHDCQIDFIQQE